MCFAVVESDKKEFSISVNFEEVFSVVSDRYLSVTLSPNGQEEVGHFNFRHVILSILHVMMLCRVPSPRSLVMLSPPPIYQFPHY